MRPGSVTSSMLVQHLRAACARRAGAVAHIQTYQYRAPSAGKAALQNILGAAFPGARAELRAKNEAEQ